MNVKRALEWSRKHDGRAVSRAHPGDAGFGGWISWRDATFVYKLTFEDLTAEDWEPAAETVGRETKGRWAIVEPEPREP